MSAKRKVVKKCEISPILGDASFDADARNVQRLINLLLAIIKQKTNKLIVVSLLFYKRNCSSCRIKHLKRKSSAF